MTTKILYHSAAPWVATGYGTCTQHIAPRLHNDDFEIAIQCLKSINGDPIKWHGDHLDYELNSPMTIYPSEDAFGLKNIQEHYKDFDADFYFTHFDTWMHPAREVIPNLGIPYVSYVIGDHKPMPDAVVDQVSNATETVSMSMYAERELEKKGIRPITIPHGVDTDTFGKLPEEETPSAVQVKSAGGEMKEVDLDETFLFGMVAANHADRKNIPSHLEAFKMFLDNVDEDAMLYLHSDYKSETGFNLQRIRKQVGIPSGQIIWASEADYGDAGQEWLNKWYNSFDVMMNCSMGESWGLTITEAQAAGTPCIVTNFSSMPEQLGVRSESQKEVDWVRNIEGYGNSRIGLAPHGIVVKPSSHIWRVKVDAKQYLVNPEDIYRAMKYYYNNPELREAHGEAAMDYVNNRYDWENDVVPQFRELFRAVGNIV